jgi:cobalt-zinc-cadmium efflux system membrane fusion protein
MVTAIRPFCLLILAALLAACGPGAGVPSAETAEEAFERGPHNGRLLRDEDFALELAIYETGVPPEFRAWATDAGRQVDPSSVDLDVELTRFGNEIDKIGFRPQDDFLRGTATVYEPHSFIVSIATSYEGRMHRWQYESFEGRTRIDAETANALGLEIMTAGPAVLAEMLTVYGRVVPNADNVRQVSARFDGAIRSVEVALGETVREGQTLARIDSNESLRLYTIDAPIAGVVTERNANPGEQTAGRTLFTIVDTSTVWVDLAVPLSDRPRVPAGAKVTLMPTTGGLAAEGAISQINVLADANQTVKARVVLDNGDSSWVLGTFVTAEIRIAEHDVPLAVKRSGLQTFRDFTVVYAQVGDEYEVRMLELGRQAGDWVEVLGGLKPGTRYVTENSYVLKADIEKSGASHDH